MDWGQLSAFVGVVVAVGVAQMVYVRGYVDKVVAEVRTEIAVLRGEMTTGFAQISGRMDLLDKDVQAIATKAHDHP